MRHDGTAMELPLLLSRSSEIRLTLRSTRKEEDRQNKEVNNDYMCHYEMNEEGFKQTEKKSKEHLGSLEIQIEESSMRTTTKFANFWTRLTDKRAGMFSLFVDSHRIRLRAEAGVHDVVTTCGGCRVAVHSRGYSETRSDALSEKQHSLAALRCIFQS